MLLTLLTLLYIYIYIYIYMCMYICMYIYIHTHTHTHTHTESVLFNTCSLPKAFSSERVTSITEKIRQNSESITWAQGVAECVGT